MKEMTVAILIACFLGTSTQAYGYSQALTGTLEVAGQGILRVTPAVSQAQMVKAVSRAMDHVYNTTGLGGYNHRLFDGGHTLLGAWRKANQALPHASRLQRAMAAVGAYWDDFKTPKGMPIATLNKKLFDRVDTAAVRAGLPRGYLYRLATYTPVELLAAAVGAVAIAYHWNGADTDQFSLVVSTLLTGSLVAANPLGAVVAVIGLARLCMLVKDFPWRGFGKGVVIVAAGSMAAAALGSLTPILAIPGVIVAAVATAYLYDWAADYIYGKPIANGCYGYGCVTHILWETSWK